MDYDILRKLLVCLPESLLCTGKLTRVILPVILSLRHLRMTARQSGNYPPCTIIRSVDWIRWFVRAIIILQGCISPLTTSSITDKRPIL